ncbi:M20/M25/M40 family metallo-hydrolase [Dongia sp.]|uniref:M20/M25/M40 family metallo-hydrolase n=1 Tax=Dongia sp. TaxID=1977262 RepID=UPI0035B295F1
MSIHAVLTNVDADLDEAVERLFDLIRIPSVSTVPAHQDDCRRAAEWSCGQLRALGFTASVRDTPGHPMVVGHYVPAALAPSIPHVLFYGHYDVQPADPLERWDSAPFEPVRRRDSDGLERLYGRGMSDDKGQVMTFLEACRAYLRVHGALPLKITVLLEGEEESGSQNLAPFLKDNRDELAADVALICDTDMWDARTPAITMSLRGLIHEAITVSGPTKDLHSGVFGGPAVNPIRVLAKVLAGLHDDDGRVTLPRFYDDVPEPSAELRRKWAALDFSTEAFLGGVGLTTPAGEKDYSALEQMWCRPTAEFNGIFGGNTTPAERSVLAATATAKLTFRLVGQQDPEKIRASFRRYAASMMPPDCRVSFRGEGGSGAVAVDENNRFLTAVSTALQEEWAREPVLKGSGGAIPVVRYIKEILGINSIMPGFALEDDAIHAPNEKYNLDSFHRGIRSWVRVLDKISREVS